jgi:hypothetical protein
MVSWRELREARPDLAEGGRALLYQVGVGLAFLGTVATDGRPRVNPMCPLLTDDDMYAWIVAGPKRGDLLRDGRYTLHSFPCDDNEDAFSCGGRATLVDDDATKERMTQQFVDERKPIGLTADALTGQLLFQLDIERCLLTRTTGHGDPSPDHTIWTIRSRT